MTDQNNTIKPAHEIGGAFFVMAHQPGRQKGDLGPLTPAEADVQKKQGHITKSHADAYSNLSANRERGWDVR